MSDLDPAIMDQFYMKDGVSASDVTHVRLQLASPALTHSFSSALPPPPAFWLQLCEMRWMLVEGRGLYCCDLSSFPIEHAGKDCFL